MRPECGLELEPVRLPHTVKTLPYNYCNENDYQQVSATGGSFLHPESGQAALFCSPLVLLPMTRPCSATGGGCSTTPAATPPSTVDLTSALRLGQKNVVAVRCDSREDLNIPPFGGQIGSPDLRRHLPCRQSDIKEPAYLRDVFIEAKAEGDFRIYTSTVGETVGCTLQAEIRSPCRQPRRLQRRAFPAHHRRAERCAPVEHRASPPCTPSPSRLIRPGTGGLPDRFWTKKRCGSASAPSSSWPVAST